MLGPTMDIRYTFGSRAGVEVFDTRVDEETAGLQDRDASEGPDWTWLPFHQCPHCPLDAKTHPHCPLALSVVEIVRRFGDVISHDEVDVEVTTPQRRILTHTTSQTALRSLMGLRIACSGCPHTAFFKPMARFHLPLADETETLWRAVSVWLVAQFLRSADGKPATFDLAGLRQVYEAVQVVNRHTAERLRAATRADASLNAVVLLDIYALLVPHFIQSTLSEVRGPFRTFLAQLDRA